MNSREKVLILLKKHRGEFISGQEMAGRLALSRNSVWKAINGLRGEGYRIDAVTNKGYRLCEDFASGRAEAKEDGLSLEDIVPYLHKKIDRTLFQLYDVVESTNQMAKTMAVAGAPHGTVLIAGRQTHGRAHHNESFLSPKGGIYLSIITRPEHFSVKDPALMVRYTAVGVCEAIYRAAGIETSISGINDIFLNGKKVAGILNESASDFESGEIQWVVSGIGIHFNEKSGSFPDTAEPKLTSLFPDRPPACRRGHLAAEVINMILDGPDSSPEEIERQYTRWHTREN